MQFRQYVPRIFQAAQGDVLVTAVVPGIVAGLGTRESVTVLRTVNEPLVIIEGEKEGHKHVLVSDDPIDILLDEVEEKMGTRTMVLRTGERGAILRHDEHAAITIPANTVVEVRGGQVDFDPVREGFRVID